MKRLKNKIVIALTFYFCFLIFITSSEWVIATTYFLGLTFIGLFIYRRLINIGDFINERIIKSKK